MKKIWSFILISILSAALLTGCYPKQEESGKITLETGDTDGRVLYFFDQSSSFRTINVQTEQFAGKSYYSPSAEMMIYFDTEDGLYGVKNEVVSFSIYKAEESNPENITLLAKAGGIDLNGTHSNMATDGRYLYVAGRYGGDNCILKFCLDSGELSVFYKLPGDEWSHSIVAIKDSIMIVSSQNINMAPVPTAFFAVNLDTGESQMIKRIDSMLHIGNMAGCVYDSALYLLDLEKDALVKFDFFTGEETVLNDNLPKEDSHGSPRYSAGSANNNIFTFEYIYSIYEDDGETIAENIFTRYCADLTTGEIKQV